MGGCSSGLVSPGPAFGEAEPSSTLALQRSLLKAIGLVDEDLSGSYSEDYDVLARRPDQHWCWRSSSRSSTCRATSRHLPNDSLTGSDALHCMLASYPP